MHKVFISYSHQDEAWKDRLVPHLKTLENLEMLTVWDDRKIDAGDRWYPEIENALHSASAAVCLISANFLASDFCVKEEVPALLEREKNEGMLLIPVLLKKCVWKRVPWLQEIQMLPRNGQNVVSHFGKDELWDEVFADVAEHIAQKFDDPEFRLTPRPPKWDAPEKIDLENLPETGHALFGRQKELELLDKAWDGGATNVLSFVAWGGVGKSTLANKWLAHMAEDNYRGARRVFGWSFYSQGVNERVTSADRFIHQALEWFGDPDPTQGSAWDKGERLAKLVREQKTLLVLDGMEPLQSGDDIERGKIKDPALTMLLTRLARDNNGLCVISTREPVADLARYSETTTHIDLEQLSAEAGRALLRTNGVRGSDAELEQAVRDFGRHALAINLLGAYLHELPNHPIAEAKKIPDLDIPEEKGRHPRRVLEAFAERLGASPELELLHLLGLFDRPADLAALDCLKAEPPIPGLTDALSAQSEAKFRDAYDNLRQRKLLAPHSQHNADKLDCHPLVREHFGERLQQQFPEAWTEAHSRLYDYYKNLPEKELPDTLEEMEPLFAAVTHGCLAGKHQEAHDEVYFPRIRRKNEYFILHQLGAFGAFLSATSIFFEKLWRIPTTKLAATDQAVLLSIAGFILRALGRLREAVAPMQTGLENFESQSNWSEYAREAINLSELFLTLGEVRQATDYAHQSVDSADRSVNEFWQISTRTTLADALHQSGALDEAEELFREAEAIQRKSQPEYRFLYSQRGFQFCDLLLSQGRRREALERAEQTVEWATQRRISLLWIALDYLSLGRAHLLQEKNIPPTLPSKGGVWGSPLRRGSRRDVSHALENQTQHLAQAENHLYEAVAGLRESGNQDELPRGLLARAALYRVQGHFAKAWEDLNEVQEIAERGEMRLHLTDFHLEACRLRLAEDGGGRSEEKIRQARGHLEQAAALVEETSYHRRDGEVAELREQLANLE